jgi:hypothetical protein
VHLLLWLFVVPDDPQPAESFADRSKLAMHMLQSHMACRYEEVAVDYAAMKEDRTLYPFGQCPRCGLRQHYCSALAALDFGD